MIIVPRRLPLFGVHALTCLLAFTGMAHAEAPAIAPVTVGSNYGLKFPTASQLKSANNIPSGTANTLTLNGTSSGTVTFSVAAAAGTSNFQWPSTAGTNGYVLQTNGGNPAVFTWTPQTGSTGNLTVGTTTVSGGVDTKILFDNGGFVGEYAISGTGSVVMTSRTVNGHALSSNVTVTPSDLGLVINTHVQAYAAILSTFSVIGTSAGYLYNDGTDTLSWGTFGASWKTALAADLDANAAIWLNSPTLANLQSAVTGGVLFTGNTSAAVLEAGMYGVDGGSTDAYVASLNPGSSLVTGVHYRFRANTANSGAATLALSDSPAKAVKRVGNGGITSDLITGDILAGQWVDLIYDGTNFQMQSTSGRSFLTTAVTGLSGTANEITASASTGAVTLSLPATLTFTGKTISGGTFASSTFTAPALGTPASGILTNCSGLPNSGTTATSANTASTIVARDGSGNFTAGTITAALTGNASTATAWATGRTLSITGDIAYTSPSITGSGNVTAAGTLATVNSNVGTFGSATQTVTFTVNAKGLITAASQQTVTPAESSITFTDITTNNATTGVHGLLPKLGGGTTNFLRADGSWAAPPSGSVTTPHVYYATTSGDDTTGDGSMVHPYRTAKKCYDVGVVAAVPFSIHLGVGDFTGSNGIILDGGGVALSTNFKCVSGEGIEATQLAISNNAAPSTNANSAAAVDTLIYLEVNALSLDLSANGGDIIEDDNGNYQSGAGGYGYLWGTGEIHNLSFRAGTLTDSGGSGILSSGNGGAVYLFGMTVAKDGTIDVSSPAAINGGTTGSGGGLRSDGVRFGDLSSADPTLTGLTAGNAWQMSRCSARSSLSGPLGPLAGNILDRGGNATW